MRDLHERFIWFLSDPSVTEADFRKLRDLLDTERSSELFEQAMQIRRAYRSHDLELLGKRISTRNRIMNSDDPLVQTVAKLLLQEGQLTAKQSIAAVKDALGDGEQFPPRISFERAMRRLGDQYGDSVVASVAQRIRNTVVHNSPNGPNMDWRLK